MLTMETKRDHETNMVDSRFFFLPSLYFLPLPVSFFDILPSAPGPCKRMQLSCPRALGSLVPRFRQSHR